MNNQNRKIFNFETKNSIMRINKFKKKVKKLDKNFLIVVTIVFLFTTFFLIFLLDRSTQIGFNDPFNEIDSKINNFLIKGRQKYKNPHDYNLILNPKLLELLDSIAPIYQFKYSILFIKFSLTNIGNY